MQTMLSTLRVAAGSMLAFVVFVITLPIALFVTLSALVVGSIVALQLKSRLTELQRSVDSESAKVGDDAPQTGWTQRTCATADNGVVIDQVKIDGVWQSR